MKSIQIERRSRIERQARKWFARIRSDKHTQQDSARHRAWLAADADHRKAYREIEKLWDLLGMFAEKPEIKALIREARREVGIL